ncbi:hypothetical protein D9611_009851 [Ephemerocybe angulata]|uniref:Uncharacterized protein n=1 Tax=Ephemerocybe angulata TaxID=980116 RepID=A0A8H5CCL5_9AGAR|nr:hypothetical protein D9611_009851 [Tulosesus angulatus]
MPTITTKRSTVVLVCTVIAALFGISYIANGHQSTYFSDISNALFTKAPFLPTSAMTSTVWTSPLSGFLDRADPYRRAGSEFRPSRSSLKLAVLRNAPVEQEGFTLAVFSSDGDDDKRHYAVDHFGRIRVLQDQDVSGLQDLYSGVQGLPSTGGFRNTWVLKQPITSRPIERILLPKATLPADPAERYDQEFLETGVQGFDYNVRELDPKRPVEGYDQLPAPLWELTGAVLEGRAGEADKDDAVLDYVRGLLGNVF